MVFVDRLNDTARFASIAQQNEQSGESLQAELVRYDAVYQIPAAVLNRDGSLQFATRAELSLAGEGDRIRAALGGRRSETPGPAWPWTHNRLVVAEPVMNGRGVAGAIVTVSALGKTRSEVLRGWVRLALVEFGALVACVFTALGLTRWVLRPVRLLDHVAQDIATGRQGVRVPSESGPPELRRLAHSFNDMTAHVAAMFEAHTAFVADASHQLRNPFNALLLRLDDVAMRAPPPWQAEAALAADEGRHLADILDGLLHLADAERRGTAPRPTDIGCVVAERVGAWGAVARVRGLTLQRRGPESAIALVDPLALATAIDSVLDNALKFAPPGSTVTVDVGVRDGDWAAISVTDEGEGLTPAELARVGDRFWRSRRHQNVEGSGLGLAVARTLLAPSGAELNAAAGPGRGLRVTVRCRMA